jgi:hypothetical protein
LQLGWRGCLIGCALALALSAQGPLPRRLSVVPMDLHGSIQSKCSVVRFEPYNDAASDLSKQFKGLEIEQSFVPPNRYNVVLSCADGPIQASVQVKRRDTKVLVSGRRDGIVHESFGPGGAPETRLKIRSRHGSSDTPLFLVVAAATRVDETTVVDISPDGMARMTYPIPGKYVFCRPR